MTGAGPKRILLADHVPRRAREIKRALTLGWKSLVKVARNRDHAFELSANATARGEPFHFLMVSFGFGGPAYTELLRKLCSGMAPVGILIDKPSASERPDAPYRLVLAVEENVVSTDQALRDKLLAILGPMPHSPASMTNAKKLKDSVRYQVQRLSHTLSFGDGSSILCRIVSQIEPGPGQFRLYGMGQGCSGASVFRLQYRAPSSGTAFRKWVLKLTPDQDRAKCEHELRSYGEISKGLCDDVLSLVPGIQGADGGTAVPAEYEGWLGVMYTYLRSSRFALFDLAGIYLRPERCLAEARRAGAVVSTAPPAGDLAECFLKSLSEHLAQWYGSSCSIEKKAALWAQEKPTNERWQPPQLPPYGFALREKWRIIEALQSVASYGASLKRCRWKQTSTRVLSCVAPGSRPPRILRVLTGPQPALLAHVHGDMNANNIFLALGCNVPFLIDFACYQSRGHVLQDFARLEVALKLELMGREERTAPPGKDLNSNSFDLWCEAEDWLVEQRSPPPPYGSGAPDEQSVARAYKLCCLLRQRAKEIHDEIAGKAVPRSRGRPNFDRSYDAALLYHTVRTIRYEGLPHLKKIFAAYSAGRILDHLASQT